MIIHKSNLVQPSTKNFKTIWFLLMTAMASSFGLAQDNPKSLLQTSDYRMTLGDINIIALSDGSVPQNLEKLLTNVDSGEVKVLTEQNFQSPIVEASVNAYLIEIEDKLILVDAGTSELYGPSLGFLPGSIIKAGYKPEEIDAILITHIHTDHTGGLVTNGEITFPNAKVYISKKEFDFWMSPSNYLNTSERLKPYYEQAHLKIKPVIEAGKIRTFDYGNELFPGITPIASPGHTPGHTFYRVTSQGESIVFWGDILHSAAVQFANPDVTIIYDVDPTEAAKARKNAFEDAAAKEYWIAGDHLSFPGIGHIRKIDNGYRWYPINYTTRGEGQ
jgi:glyoxylase-like metal-dependent hydrolase (beta-lactamase superfamily II)